jgi:hypothetical protein
MRIACVLMQGQVMQLDRTWVVINQSKSERPPCSPYGPFTLNYFTFYVSKVRPTFSEKFPKSKAEELGVLLVSFICKWNLV